MTGPKRVLDDDELDVLELALGGAIPAPEASDGADDVTFTDAENTPLARLHREQGGPRLDRLRPFARHRGPAWDPGLRLEARAMRTRVTGHSTALVIDDLPTRSDLERLSSDPRVGAGDVLLAIPVSRRRPAAHVPGHAGLVRAALAFGEALGTELRRRRADARVIPVVVPWPASPPAAMGWRVPRAADVLAAYGATSTVRLAEGRDPAERDQLAQLDAADPEAVSEVYPEASARELRTRPAARRGAVVLFTGLSGSGKSTIARARGEELADRDDRRVTLLDGDEIRQHLSSELGFDPASRERNVERIGWVAALLAGHGGIAVAAPIAPFAASRARVREMVEREGAAFVLVWVSTPLGVCEARDRKGMYARARAGELRDFTGVSSPYEPPDDADVVIDTSRIDVDAAVDLVRTALDARLAA